MSEIKEEAKKTNEAPEFIADDELVVYSNASEITISAEEVVLNFGVRDIKNPGKAKSVAKIYLSLPHTKRIASILAKVLTAYESALGPIDADPNKKLNNVLKNMDVHPEKES